MKKRIFYKKKLLTNTTSTMSILTIAILIISSASISLVNTINKQEDLELNEKDIALLTGLPPQAKNKQISSPLSPINIKQNAGGNPMPLTILPNTMYGYQALPWKAFVHFPLNIPGTIPITTILSNPPIYDLFLTGGTWTNDGKWLCCGYNIGALYEINPDTGIILSYIGGGDSLNGLAYDPINNKLYGASSDKLYEITIDTGEQTPIGSFGLTDSIIIGIACDSSGNMYAWDVKFEGDSYIYDVDKTDGSVYNPRSLGVTLCFAQDGAFDYDTNTLFLSAYIISSPYNGCYLCTVDIIDDENVVFSIIGQFEGNAEITASVIPYEPTILLDAIIDIDPNHLNSGAGMPWITCYIELPAGNVALINKASIRLNGLLGYDSTGPSSNGLTDENGNGTVDMMVKFDKDAAVGILGTGTSVPITITGSCGGIPFQGVDHIDIV